MVEKKITRREFLKKIGTIIAVVTAGKIGEMLIRNSLPQKDRQEKLSKLIKEAKRDISRESDKEIEKAFKELQEQAKYIMDVLDSPRKNFPEANFPNLMEQIKIDEQEPKREWNESEEEYLARLQKWHQLNDSIYRDRREFLMLVQRVSEGNLTMEEKRSLFKVPRLSRKSTKCIDFEKIGAQSDHIEQYLSTTFPPNFLSCTHTIYYTEELHSTGQAGIEEDSDGRHAVKIRGAEINWKDLDPTAQAVLAHEISHNADWSTNPFLSPAERIYFYALILQRLQAQDRYHSTYVEIKHQLDRDPRKWNNSLKIYSASQEYWADICETYFSGYQRDWIEDWGEPNLPEKDIEVIEWLLARIDPDWLLKNQNQYPKTHPKSKE